MQGPKDDAWGHFAQFYCIFFCFCKTIASGQEFHFQSYGISIKLILLIVKEWLKQSKALLISVDKT